MRCSFCDQSAEVTRRGRLPSPGGSGCQSWPLFLSRQRRAFQRGAQLRAYGTISSGTCSGAGGGNRVGAKRGVFLDDKRGREGGASFGRGIGLPGRSWLDCRFVQGPIGHGRRRARRARASDRADRRRPGGSLGCTFVYVSRRSQGGGQRRSARRERVFRPGLPPPRQIRGGSPGLPATPTMRRHARGVTGVPDWRASSEPLAARASCQGRRIRGGRKKRARRTTQEGRPSIRRPAPDREAGARCSTTRGRTTPRGW